MLTVDGVMTFFIAMMLLTVCDGYLVKRIACHFSGSYWVYVVDRWLVMVICVVLYKGACEFDKFMEA